MEFKKVSNWNNYPVIESAEYLFRDRNTFQNLLDEDIHFIGRGNGRSYGDASLASHICSNLTYNKILFFNDKTGILTAQSGILLDDILSIIIPRGWFLPVTPGTKYITLAGAVAADVHGKNHHLEGSFSRHINYLELLLSNGAVIKCSSTENQELFHATCGGMGLTGFITKVSFKLKKIDTSLITQRQIKVPSLEKLLENLDIYDRYTYSVAWIDCLARGKSFGRGILMLGEHSKENELRNTNNILKVDHNNKINIPFVFPGFVLNKWSIKIFNEIYYNKNTRSDNTFYSGYNGFFYPLDFINNWNRIYGSDGFVQYQFVIPKDRGKEGLEKLLIRISDKGWGSFLAVLKLFGKQDEGIISFPMEGYTLALDFPLKKGLFQFLDELDKIVIDYGGRLYLAKDARMSKETFKKGYPSYEKFRKIVYKYNPEKKFESNLSKRLSIL